MLDPDVVLRADEVAALSDRARRRPRSRRARSPSSGWPSPRGPCSSTARPGSSPSRDGEIYSVAAFTVVDGRIVEIDIVTTQSGCAG